MLHLAPSVSLEKSLFCERRDRMRAKRFPVSRHVSYSSTFDDHTSSPTRPTNRGGQRIDRNAKSIAISINKEIVALGKAGKWKELLSFYQNQRQYFDPVNHATLMSQVARIRQVRRDDPLFEAFLSDLSTKLHLHGITWLGSPREVANTVHAIAKMGLDPNSNSSVLNIMRLLDDQSTAEWMFKHGNSQEIANCIWACGRLKFECQNMFRLLDERATWFVQSGTTPQGMANCIWACATLEIESPNLFRLLDENVEWMFEHGNPQGIANCTWACGRSNIKSSNLFRLIDERAEWLFQCGNHQDIANCIWACARVGIESPNLFRLLDERAEWVFYHGIQQEIANCIWACGTLDVESPNMFKMLDERAEWLFQNGKPQEIANCMWACAKLGVKSPTLFRLIEERAEWLFKNGNQQEIASCVWACGTLGIESPNLFKKLDERAEWLFHNAKPQEIANCTWACGTLGMKSPNLFRLLDARAEWLFDHGNQQVIANCLWACGTLEIKCLNLLKLLDERAELLVDSGSSQGLANCAWACAKLGIQSPNLFRLLDEHAEWLVENGSSQEIANCAYALSVMGTRSHGFFSALERRLNGFLLDANSQDLCNVCYAIVVLDLRVASQSDMLANLWNDLLARQINERPIEELQQVLYVQAFASAFGTELTSPPSVLQTQLDRVPFTTESSRFEKTVSSTLLDMGFSHQQEISPFESIPGMLSIDLACADRRIAIECDGPSHYLSVPGEAEDLIENGQTKAKRRLLQHLGWNVINLNWAEARQHDVSQEWLRGKLSNAGVVS
jgi:hypothetical protein